MFENYIKTKTNLILKQIKNLKNAMRAREPNSWPIRCHRTWTRELAVSCPSIYNSTCWRWKIITSQLLMLLIRWTTRTIEWTFMTNCPSSLKTFLLRLPVSRTLKGVFFCVRPAYCWLQKQNYQVIANASLFETEQKSFGVHRHQCLCVNFGTLTLMEMNCK